MAENFADQTLIDDGNDEFFASLDLADEEKSEESSKHFSNIIPMTSTYPKASLNMQHEMIFGHNSYNPQSILDELVYVPETTHKIRKSNEHLQIETSENNPVESMEEVILQEFFFDSLETLQFVTGNGNSTEETNVLYVNEIPVNELCSIEDLMEETEKKFDFE